MNKSIILFITIISVSLGYAQSPLDEEGNQFSLSSGYTTKGIPIAFNYEMGIHEDISFGIEGSMRIFNESGDTSDYSHTILGFSFFGNYYFNTLLKLDEKKWGLYGGVHLSYYKWLSPDGYNESGNSSSTLAIGAQLGGRYYFGKNWGIFLEAVGNSEYLGGKLGMTYRLR